MGGTVDGVGAPLHLQLHCWRLRLQAANFVIESLFDCYHCFKFLQIMAWTLSALVLEGAAPSASAWSLDYCLRLAILS